MCFIKHIQFLRSIYQVLKMYFDFSDNFLTYPCWKVIMWTTCLNQSCPCILWRLRNARNSWFAKVFTKNDIKFFFLQFNLSFLVLNFFSSHNANRFLPQGPVSLKTFANTFFIFYQFSATKFKDEWMCRCLPIKRFSLQIVDYVLKIN